MTGRHWRFIAFVVCGLAFLTATYLLVVTDWYERCADGSTAGFTDGCPASSTLEGDGLGGRIGTDALFAAAFLSFAGAVATAVAELHVRSRTNRRPKGGGFWSTRP